MSDYLWDKTGEPDEDVEQLEQLLDALKYQPRPLVIPGDAMPSVKSPVMRSQHGNVFAFPRTHLAVAASLMLMLLAGTWLVLRQREVTMPQPSMAERGSGASASGRPEIATGANVEAGDKPSVNAPAGTKENATKQQQMSVPVVMPVVNKTHRPSRRVTVRQPHLKEELTIPRGEVAVNSTRQEGARAITEEGRAATEKLMLALRLASAKLNYAQREVQEISRAGN